jgi:hypothetical protein
VGIVLLIIFLLGASFQIHNYWKEKDAQARQADKINFMKNMALVGVLLMILILPQPWPLSVRLGQPRPPRRYTARERGSSMLSAARRSTWSSCRNCCTSGSEVRSISSLVPKKMTLPRFRNTT